MLSKSDIDYLDFVWEFFPGCLHGKDICPVSGDCWAKDLAHRFHRDSKPHFIPEKLLDPLKGKQGGRRIGVCFTGDLGGEWVDPDEEIGVENAYKIWATPLRDNNVKPFIKFQTTLKDIVFQVCNECPQHNFIFLTKRPDRLPLWSIFPANAWVGATVCNNEMLDRALLNFGNIYAKTLWLSFEPLMERISISPLDLCKVSWVIIGAWSKGHKDEVKIEWVREIVEAADKASIPVFIKSNLTNESFTRQGEPKGDAILTRFNAPWAFKWNDPNPGWCVRREYPKEAY